MMRTPEQKLVYADHIFGPKGFDWWSRLIQAESYWHAQRHSLKSAEALESYLKFLATFNPTPAFLLRWIHFGEPNSHEPLWWFSNSIRPTHFMQRTLGTPNLEPLP